jgi:hypothetical protein
MPSFLIVTILGINTHENNWHLTPVQVVLCWFDCYCHFGAHTVHMQTLYNSWNVQIVLLQIIPPFSTEILTRAQTWRLFYKWLALSAANICCCISCKSVNSFSLYKQLPLKASSEADIWQNDEICDLSLRLTSTCSLQYFQVTSWAGDQMGRM